MADPSLMQGQNPFPPEFQQLAETIGNHILASQPAPGSSGPTAVAPPAAAGPFSPGTDFDAMRQQIITDTTPPKMGVGGRILQSLGESIPSGTAEGFIFSLIRGLSGAPPSTGMSPLQMRQLQLQELNQVGQMEERQQKGKRLEARQKREDEIMGLMREGLGGEPRAGEKKTPMKPTFRMSGAGPSISFSPESGTGTGKYNPIAIRARDYQARFPDMPEEMAQMQALRDEEAVKKPPKEKTDLRSKPGIFVDIKGNPMPKDVKYAEDAVGQGYFAIARPTAVALSAGSQSMQMLKNVADLIEKLRSKGKLINPGGAENDVNILGDVVGLKWKNIARDPDVRQLQQSTSQLVSLSRNLGDKGVRAMQAYQGLISLFEAGGADYTTMKAVLGNIDNELRASKPVEVPQAWEDLPGARGMQDAPPTPDEHKAADDILKQFGPK